MTGARPSTQVRGRCQICGRMYILTSRNRVRTHYLPKGEQDFSEPDVHGPRCEGSGRVPA